MDIKKDFPNIKRKKIDVKKFVEVANRVKKYILAEEKLLEEKRRADANNKASRFLLDSQK